MKVGERFEVGQPADEVWALFREVPEVVQCLPGAELLESLGGDRYRGRVTVRLGPVTTAFEGEATVRNDAGDRTGHIQGRGVDRKSGSRGSIEVAYGLAEIPAGTEVRIDADIVLSGAAAQFGRPGLVRELSARILRDFAANLEARLASSVAGSGDAASAGPTVALPHSELRGFPLLWSSLLALLRGFLARIFGRR